MPPESTDAPPTKPVAIGIRLLLAAVLVGAAGTVYYAYGDRLTLAHLARQEAEWRSYQRNHPLLVYLAAFGVYVAVTGLSLPGAVPLSLIYGWYFGFWRGVILVSVASTTGASIAFLLSRFLLREFVQRRFGARLKAFNDALDRDGPFYLFTLRLVPAVPFWMINLVMGLTSIRPLTFWWVSQLGMLPGTVVYLYAGASVPSLQRLADEGIRAVFTPWQVAQIVVAFALLGTFPLGVRRAMQHVRRRHAGIGTTASSLSQEAPEADDGQPRDP